MKRFKNHPILYSLLLSTIISIIVGVIFLGDNWKHPGDIIGCIFFSMLAGNFMIYPFLLTIINIVTLFWRSENQEWIKNIRIFEYMAMIFGFIYSGIGLVFLDIQFQSDWWKVLRDAEVHTPIWTVSYPTVICLSCIGVIGYLTLACIRIEKMPPLVIVSAIAGMYLGILECVLWIIHIFSSSYILLCLFPLNCIIIAAKTIRYKILEWNEKKDNVTRSFNNKYLAFLNQKMINSGYWPITAFVLMWPILGIIICVLALFGQQPDNIIKAWTETSDWNLSHRLAPQNVITYDEHYLCTVAAGGHARIVKPIRLGERHGHRVIVNRQLCVANAFEQILEERTPMFHKYIRNFYDTYGFPIAKMIHFSYMADMVYFIMKPLEWLFLIVLYFCDVNPENRIAVQYLRQK
ncbi:DUF6688 domain-containing protein [Clostridium chromiireducens]|uniref:DUF6688 domain-containing protein n=1 Tax=Clostridium chromiireducens TaxID=225345 RepID=UPI003AF848F9